MSNEENKGTTKSRAKRNEELATASHEMEFRYEDLFTGNRRWVERTLAQDPQYFEKLAAGQRPRFLWIGCSDSRVPANVITDTASGDVFVHRNIANVVVHTDPNLLSVLQYAVEHLRVQHVIVCGHYGCGGVAAALSNKDFGFMNVWLRHIKDVAGKHGDELRAIKPEAAVRRLVELNVIEQVYNLAETAIVQRAWANNQPLALHGWVYDVADGLIRDLEVNFTSAEVLDRYYRLEF